MTKINLNEINYINFKAKLLTCSDKRNKLIQTVMSIQLCFRGGESSYLDGFIFSLKENNRQFENGKRMENNDTDNINYK